MNMRILIALLGTVAWMVGGANAAVAAPPPPVVLTQIATGVGQPVMLAEPDDGSERLFIVDRLGKIRVVADGQLLSAPYLQINVPTTSEQGLLGMAFDPDFADNGTFYLTFTAPSSEPRLGTQPDQVLARFVTADPAANEFSGSRTDVLHVPDLYVNHNGGDIQFGPDGYLYWSMGDGGSGGDPNNLAQNTWRKQVSGYTYYLLGKMLRLDVRNGTSTATAETCGAAAGQTLEYRIPPDNPFVGSSQTCDEIYHYGLRNPWRFSFDRLTDELYIADVGESTWEEVDVVPYESAGRNFGWNCIEGHADYHPSNCSAGTLGLVMPVFDYSHTHGCSITGGYVYRGPAPGLDGLYFYGDYCRNSLYYADPANGYWHDGPAGISGEPMSVGLNLDSSAIGFGEDLAGHVYVTLSGGTVYRIDSDAVFIDGFEP